MVDASIPQGAGAHLARDGGLAGEEGLMKGEKERAVSPYALV